MANIDLPDYLKRSKILNNLTVRRLLQYWAIVCSAAVITLSLVAVITNDIVSSKQEKLNNTAIPIEENVRHLDHVLYAFEQRQQALIKAETLDEYEINLDRSALQQRFSDYFLQLNLRITELDNAKPIVNDLEENYNRFLEIDSKLTDHLKTKYEFSTASDIPENFGEQLGVIEAEIMSRKLDIQANLKRLSTMTSQYIKSLAGLSFNISQINLLVVVALSLIVVAVIAAGISVVLYRIDTPLGNLSGAMHDLSHGDMSRRLQISELIRDEFSDLSFDFNKFAARTQSLFDEVIDANDALEESEKRTRAILENALVGIAHLKDQHIVSVNQKFEDLFGYSRETLTGMHIKKLYPTDDDYKAINETTEQLLASGETYHGEWKLKHESGNHFWCDVSAKSISEDNIDEGTIWLFEDITQRKSSEDELRRLANYDTLTDLPNRALFQDRLMQATESASRKNNSMALIYIDLDRFKKINDSFGHSLGDELLKIVSRRLCECVRGSDTVSRLGGDEFTIILPDLQSISDPGKVSEKIILKMDESFKLENQEVSISPSIGISIFPDDARDMETILKNADAAMYHAKSKGRNNYQYYTQEMNAKARHRLDLEGRLRRSIDNHDFKIYYQPQVDVKSLSITGYEALIRWQDGENGLVSPVEFVPILEDTGLIVPVGEWILHKVCDDIPHIRKLNSNLKSVSVNFSARQFIDNTLFSHVENILSETGVSTDEIVIEITETILMTEKERSLKILSELSEFGLKLSLDDFGTGYSSLAYLKQFPIDIIKIDQSFVRDLHKDTSDAAICEAIIAIAEQLRLKVVAEGVETQDQFDFMSKRGCDSIQGYFFGKPVPLPELVCSIEDQHAAVS